MVDTAGAPPPPPPPPPAPGSRSYLPWALGAAAVAAILIIAVVVLGGDDGPRATTTQAGSTSTAATSTSTTSPPSTTAPTTTTTTTEPPSATGGSWTVLVYMLADNNLEPVIIWDFEEMAGLPPSEDLTILVLADRSDEYTEREILNLPDWQTAKVIEVGTETLVEVDDLGEVDMGDPAVLTNFLVDSITRYPADHYALVMWDHGAPDGIGSDDSSGGILATTEIGPAVRSALDTVGVPRLDIIGFDACLMGALDVAAAVAPVARYMIASEELEPGTGWDYGAFGYVADEAEGTPDGLGRTIVERFVAGSAENDPTVTLSLIDLDAVGDLQAALDDLAIALASDPGGYAATIGRERTRVLAFGSSPNPDEDFNMIDLGDLLGRVAGSEPGLSGPAEAALAALDTAVLESGSGSSAAAATGLSVYFPPYAEYFWEGYREFAAPEWMGFLDTYYSAGAAIPDAEQPDFTPIGNEALWQFDEFGLSVSGDFGIAAEGSAVDATLYSGVVEEDGSFTFIGEDQGFLEGETAFASFDLTVLTLFDGVDRAYAYQDISFNEDASIITLDIPVAYYPPGSSEWIDALISLVYDSNTEEFTETVYGYDASGTIGLLEPEPDGLFVPWLLRQYPDGTVQWEQLADVGLWSDMPNLLYEWDTLEAGTPMYAELWVCDFGGNCDFAAVETTVPAGFDTDTADTCVNDYQGFSVTIPEGWSVWDDPDDMLDCQFFDPDPLDGLNAAEAYDAAGVTIEMVVPEDLQSARDYLAGGSVATDATLGGLPAERYESDFGVGYLTELDGGGALVLIGWEEYETGAGAVADWMAPTITIFG